jgi:hypothetical protein
MPRALTQIQQDVVETRLRLNVAHKDIAEEIGCGLQQIRKMSSNLKNFDSVVVPKVRKRGRPLELTQEMVDVGPFIHLIFKHVCRRILM